MSDRRMKWLLFKGRLMFLLYVPWAAVRYEIPAAIMKKLRG